MIRIALCDTSIESYYIFSRFLKKYESSSCDPILIHYYSSAEELLFSYQGQYDVLFLETIINKKSGIDTARCIRKMDERVFIVFVTVHDNYGAESYQVHATNYLIKPFTYEMFKETMEQIHIELLKENYYIITKSEDRIIKLLINDILYIDYCNHKLTFHMFQGNTEKAYGSYKYLFEQKHTECLYQIHKSYVVNMLWIESIEDKTVYIKNISQGFPVSRGRWKLFLDAYKLFAWKKT